MPPNALAFLATLPIVLMTSPLPSATQVAPRTLVALLAHADDEGAAAPVLARYAREGVQVHFIISTDGAGGSGSSGYLKRSESGPTGDALVAARDEEARCSAAAQIERLRPDVVITWGPDGGTGHPDHRLMSNIATQLQRAGAPGMPERLYYMYLPVEAFRQLSPERGEPPMLFPQAKYFTVHVPFAPQDLEAAQKAMACHRSQFTPELLQRLLPEHGRVWPGKVAFIPAFSHASSDDLFR